MKITVENIKSSVEYGGEDYLLKLPTLLNEYLRAKVEGSHFIKRKGWDGYQYFINANGDFATGFLPLLLAYAEELGATVQLIDNRINVPAIIGEDYELPEFDLAEHQIKLVEAVKRNVAGIYFPRGIWDAATNSGKTASAASLIKNVENYSALILVDGVDLFNQHYEFLCTVFPNEVGRVNGKHYDIKRVTLAMARTLYNKIKNSPTVAKDIYNRFNIVIVDECHRAGAKEFSYVLQRVNAGMRIFMGGTPLASGNDVRNMVIVGLSSNVIAKISKKDLMDKNISLKATVNFYHSKEPDGEYESYDLEYSNNVMQSVVRAEQIAEICSERAGKKILINVVQKLQLITIYEVLTNSPLLSNFYIDYIHGTDKDRTEKLAQFSAAGKNKIIISTSIMKLGLNIKDIDVLVYAQGGKAVIDLSQWSGRAERHDGVSESMEIVDFWDNGKHISKHSSRRKNIWLNEKFVVNYAYENRRGKPTAQNEEKPIGLV